jgi:hypothetical protein
VWQLLLPPPLWDSRGSGTAGTLSLPLKPRGLEMSNIVLIWLIRLFEVLFFTGVAGCSVTIVLSWYLIFKEEFTSKD